MDKQMAGAEEIEQILAMCDEIDGYEAMLVEVLDEFLDSEGINTSSMTLKGKLEVAYSIEDRRLVRWAEFLVGKIQQLQQVSDEFGRDH